MATQSSVKEVVPEVGGSFSVDQAVVEAFPENSRLVEAFTYGTAAWTRAVRISIELNDGQMRSYFLKCASEDRGKTMMEGEYNSMLEIHQCLPTFVPRPITWGRFRQAPVPTYFFLAEFVDMSTGAPDPAIFASRLSQLHKNSQSPMGKFDFHIITCHGPNWQNTQWHENWSFYFGRLLTQFFERDIEHNGNNEEYENEFKLLKSNTIPKILEPLQSDGRVLEPRLIHGDLWEENCGTKLETGEPVVFDAASMYAHNEFELGMWRRDIVRFGKAHIRHYLKLVPPSEPREQWDDRNRLYSIKYDLAHSIALPETAESQRQL
ncbi:hypothetical protein LTR20_009449 [Exophiala xenobiotica]|nr:hypothetical protein LTS13_009870 [Exophiala xenobiotica]KAK5393289.1 hypothetical protein LTR79_009603 [Exophiala xenobiotica]KAK5408081.1 hypothetical protein LTR90_009537 [Exophiala xenobiotica]KAK5456508.1 hypothetical protein LTR20_009449 [Exophiala xenobiotica]KAK5472410.1 hypothetical protein LTR26_010536 [Exophiala xenobiotica]